MAKIPLTNGPLCGTNDNLPPISQADIAIAQYKARQWAEIERSEGKLANPGFVEKAPPAVVEAEREKLARLRAELEAL